MHISRKANNFFLHSNIVCLTLQTTATEFLDVLVLDLIYLYTLPFPFPFSGGS